ncbi:MAG: hypothetical protein HUU20_15975 [Pirellulales bacterium]|nr:hypothetical protein [Pirellulales bacterium]
MAATARPEIRADLANLQLAAIERLEGRREQFSPADRRTYEFARAQALAGAGRVEEAGQALDSLAQAYPRDGEIQEAHAALLLAGTDRASLERSLAKWRQVEEKAAPASERWFRAKYNVASLHYRLGNREQAARIIRLLQIVHPELGGPERKRQFLELLAQATR